MSKGSRIMHRVFVYGTLKRDEPNYYVLQKCDYGHAEYVGRAVTCDKYPLVVATRYNIPFLLSKCGTGKNVEGELFDVDDSMLASLDKLEGCPSWYSRLSIPIVLTTDGHDNRLEVPVRQNVQVYLLENYKKELLDRVMLTDYSSKGQHNLPYDSAWYVRVEEWGLIHTVINSIVICYYYLC
ncbi:PREDICTED: gamma-glutamylaminecyclotransferase C-like isoform X2 [Priapulus caudatus]|uniref:Gamma-glutamylcyclotransferase family protein n=1 Tax=Priapulus caudatus TaxID=37621 RepID=A0ABM1F4S8_PRICU|nr:PREDICTED: gamma-glutamylaminecyclotransferase C-like isoform X2 [Priapulus caudatus]